MEEGALLLRRPQESFVDRLGGEGCCQRHVAAGDPLGDAEEVRRHVLLLAGEHRPGAAESGRHLVADQQDPVVVAQFAHHPQVAGRVGDHPGRALNQWLDDHRGDLISSGREDARHVGGVARLGLVGLEQQRPVGRVEEVDATDRDRADRVAVVGVAEADEASPLGMAAALLLVLEGHLQRHLGRGRAGVRVEDAGEAGRGDPGQAAGELGGAGMGEAEHGRVGDLVELLAHGGVEHRVAVAVDRAPERGDAVDVAVAVDVDQVAALAALDHQRLFVGPPLLLGERVPDVVVVELRVVSGHRGRP